MTRLVWTRFAVSHTSSAFSAGAGVTTAENAENTGLFPCQVPRVLDTEGLDGTVLNDTRGLILSPEVLNGEASSPAFSLFQQDTDRMSRFLTTTTASVLLLCAAGCYQPMYQPYGYGQPMYGPGYAQPGTMVVPPGNAPLYQPGASGTSNPSTFEEDKSSTDDFKRDPNDGKFFNGGSGDPVPTPKDPSATDSGTQKFNSDFGN